jgi:hypothetical protein
MRAQVIHDDDVARPESGNQHLFHIEPEAFAIDRAVDQPWRLDPVEVPWRQ